MLPRAGSLVCGRAQTTIDLTGFLPPLACAERESLHLRADRIRRQLDNCRRSHQSWFRRSPDDDDDDDDVGAADEQASLLLLISWRRLFKIEMKVAFYGRSAIFFHWLAGLGSARLGSPTE